MIHTEREFQFTVPEKWSLFEDENVKYYWYRDSPDFNYGVNVFSEYVEDGTTLDELLDFVLAYNSKYVNKFAYYDIKDTHVGKFSNGSKGKLIQSEMSYHNNPYRLYQSLFIKDGIRYTFNVIGKTDIQEEKFNALFRTIFRSGTFKA